MSLVELRVELPAYAHSFLIHVPSSCTILDVKQEIFQKCVGAPRVDGQRLIWRGRYLVDSEKLDELWKSCDETRIVHLAVHPSAWSSTPLDIPKVPQPQVQSTIPKSRPAPQSPPESPSSPVMNSPPTISQVAHSLTFVLFKHQIALRALTPDAVSHVIDVGDLSASRSLAVQAVESHGWTWPAILDEEFPAATAGGLKYDCVTLNGQSFLSLNCPSEDPTALQAHALKVLTCTFSLLSIPTSQTNNTRTIPSQTVPIPPNVNMMLQQLGLPQLRVAQIHNQNYIPNGILPELREMPLRPLLAPLMMLLFRTLLLLYFVAPARKPIFGILVVAWMLYEIWRPIRDGLVRGLRRGVPNDLARQDAPARQEPRPVQNALEAPRPPQNFLGAAIAERVDNQAAAVVLDTISSLNISTEEQILNDAPGAVTREPGFGHKVITFFSLFLTTIHPAVWNQRRAALRRREGRIRTEGHSRDSSTAGAEGEDGQNETRVEMQRELRAQHARRPRWIRDYMERVIAGDWVDDSD